MLNIEDWSKYYDGILKDIDIFSDEKFKNYLLDADKQMRELIIQYQNKEIGIDEIQGLTNDILYAIDLKINSINTVYLELISGINLN